MLQYIWLIPVLPLMGVLINAFFGYRLGRRMVGIIASSVVGLAFLVSLGVWAGLSALPAGERSVTQTLFTWIAAGSFNVRLSYLVDPLSVVMLLVVTGVGCVIHVYSIGYMADDAGYARYFAYLNLFVFSMLTLVLADNFLVLYAGWELVGLCSYLLIGFWYTRKSAADAGKKAFIVNRVGDFGFALGIFLIFTVFGSLDYARVFEVAPKLLAAGGATATAITLLLFAGATGKSAQIPLYVWLPDAMEGPTPVSALIHAATMVTAGVYMVARTHVLFELAPFSLLVVATIGAVTALFAASIGLVQNDIKRVLAYSTISQLGYMFLGVGVTAYAAGIFHLFTHAFFKALLFLGAGSVMHALGGEQDMRRMGGLLKYIPRTGYTFIIGALTLAGFPLITAGFFSKGEIITATFEHGQIMLWLIALVTAGMTGFYALRQVGLIFFGEERFRPAAGGHGYSHTSAQAHHGEPHESPAVMTVPLIILAFFSVTAGYIMGGFEHWLAPVFEAGHAVAESEAAGGLSPVVLETLTTLVALGGMGLGYLMYIRRSLDPQAIGARFPGLYHLLLNKYKIDELYGLLFVRPFNQLSMWMWQGFDVPIIDGAVNGVGQVVVVGSQVIRRIQTGYVRSYALTFLLGVIVILAYCVLRF